MAKALAQFSIVRTGEDYLLTIEDQDGESIEFTVGDDHLDLIIEAIEEQLDMDDENTVEEADGEEDKVEEDD